MENRCVYLIKKKKKYWKKLSSDKTPGIDHFFQKEKLHLSVCLIFFDCLFCFFLQLKVSWVYFLVFFTPSFETSKFPRSKQDFFVFRLARTKTYLSAKYVFKYVFFPPIFFFSQIKAGWGSDCSVTFTKWEACLIRCLRCFWNICVLITVLSTAETFWTVEHYWHLPCVSLHLKQILSIQ